MRPSEIALKYANIKELPGNVFGNDTEFGRKLHAAGQKDGEAYCAYTQEVIFKEALPNRVAELDKLFNASAVQTFKNFRDAAFLNGFLPQIDCLVFWQKYVNGKADWRGHMGVVISIDLDGRRYKTVEGNTGGGVNNREGDGVYIKSHNLEGAATVENGLRLLGFIQVV